MQLFMYLLIHMSVYPSKMRTVLLPEAINSHSTSSLCTDMCIDLCSDIYIDACIDIYAECADMCSDMCG